MFSRDDLFNFLKNDAQVLVTPALESAFRVVDRKDFIHSDYEYEAYEDYALPLGKTETVSKPSIAAFMLELLGVEPGDSVLEVGAGSGYLTALLSVLAGQEGTVTALEIDPELVALSRANLAKYDFANTDVELANIALPAASARTFRRILMTSDVQEIPPRLLDELASPGVLVLPVGGSITRISKDDRGKLVEESFGNFTFRPLVE